MKIIKTETDGKTEWEFKIDGLFWFWIIIMVLFSVSVIAEGLSK